MIPARPFVIALLLSAGAGGAGAADDPDKGLVACIEKARQADATCAKLTDEPAQRLECFQKARAEQLGCLEHALSDAPTGATAPVSPPEPSRQTSPGEQPSKSATSEPPSQPAAPPAQASPQENPGRPAESTQANSPANPPANPQMSTQETAPTQDNAVTNAPEPRPDTATASPPANPPPATVEATPQPPAAQTVEHPPAAARAEMQKGTKETSKDTPKETTNKETTNKEAINKDATKETPKPAPKPSEAQAKPPESKWVVSETTSPIDYRPLLTAVIQPSSSSPGSPSRLAVRCRGTQTEFLIHTDGTWQTQRKNVLPVDRQVNDQAVMHERWTLSADGKTATYAENTIELLKSLPDGARLTVNVTDAANARHEATFQLTGWDAIRKKIAAACKWPKMIDQASGHR
jgi:hypothetical protein